jgi:hypothetical protein
MEVYFSEDLPDRWIVAPAELPAGTVVCVVLPSNDPYTPARTLTLPSASLQPALSLPGFMRRDILDAAAKGM